MLGVELEDLFDDDAGEEGIGADGAGVIKAAAADGIGVAAEDLGVARTAGPAQCGAGLGVDAEEDGDVLVGVEAIGDEEGDDDDVGRRGLLLPVGDEGIFFHEHAEDLFVLIEGLDAGDLFFYGEAGIFIEGGAVADDDERGVAGIDGGSNFAGAMQEELRHIGVIADGVAVLERARGEAGAGREVCDGAIEAEFAGDDLLGEIAFADEIGDDVDSGLSTMSRTWR